MGESFGLVVPVFDERSRFGEYGKLLTDFIVDQPAGSELLFVDDGSTDGTADLIDELLASQPDRPVRLLRRVHEGKGAAVAAGLREVGGELLGFCDLDLSTPLEDLERIMRVASRAPVLAIGSRDLAGSRLLRPESPVREALGRTYNRLLQATITPGVLDTQCGAKVARRAIWDAVLPHCRERGFAWDAEAVAVALTLGIQVQEVAIAWRHDDRTKVRLGTDGAAMVWATARVWRNARRVTAQHNPELPIREDRQHWWFRSKAALVATALRRTARDSVTGRLVDAGGGTGGVTARLGWASEKVVLVERNQALAGQARGVHGLIGVSAEVERLPLIDASAEVVCLLDVLEHVADPLDALREAARVLEPGGRLVINVPAHPWLWSGADECLGHVRRYSRPLLREQLVAAGLRPSVMSHVFSWLVPPVWLKRRLAKGGEAELGLDQGGTLVDRAAMVLTALERMLIGRVPLPIGTSILCVAEKPQ